jgi:hypothetical protein
MPNPVMAVVVARVPPVVGYEGLGGGATPRT